MILEIKSSLFSMRYILLLILFILFEQCEIVNCSYRSPSFYKANFEDSRCRCICPSPEFFRSHNNTPDQNGRRYYTKTNLNPLICNSHTVVKESVQEIVDENRIDAFLANCNCKFQSRNSLLLKYVVLFVICVIMGLFGYMMYLLVVDPMIRRPVHFIPYRRQEDDVGFSHTFWFSKDSDSESETIDENIFATATNAALEETPGADNFMQMRPRLNVNNRTENVLGKVEAGQSKWMNNVEEQRRKVMMDHTMLN